MMDTNLTHSEYWRRLNTMSGLLWLLLRADLTDGLMERPSAANAPSARQWMELLRLRNEIAVVRLREPQRTMAAYSELVASLAFDALFIALRGDAHAWTGVDVVRQDWARRLHAVAADEGPQSGESLPANPRTAEGLEQTAVRVQTLDDDEADEAGQALRVWEHEYAYGGELLIETSARCADEAAQLAEMQMDRVRERLPAGATLSVIHRGEVTGEIAAATVVGAQRLAQEV